jgi:anti-anti-sigma regulatory factor
MAMIAEWLKIDEERVVQGLQEVREKLDSVEGEVALDFFSVRRLDASALKAMEELAGIADDKSVKVVLRAVHVGVYRVLKLVKLTSRFSFAS